MSFKTVSVSPPNSVVLVMDPDAGDVPQTMGGRLIAATSSSIAVGCLSEHDGQTSLHLGSDGVTPDHTLAFEGTLATPNRLLAICSVSRQPYVSIDVPAAQTGVQIWLNDDSEPDDIRVVVVPAL